VRGRPLLSTHTRWDETPRIQCDGDDPPGELTLSG